MIRAATRIVQAGALAFLLAVLAVSPATAERLIFDDEAGDVWSYENGGWSDKVPIKNADIDRSAVRYGTHRVTIRVDYERLTKRAAEETALDVDLLTTGAHWYHVYLGSYGPRQAGVILTKGAADRRVDCDGLVGEVRYRADRARIRVPRGCLGGPRWIRYRAQAWCYTESTGLFVDDARSSRPFPKAYSARIKRS